MISTKLVPVSTIACSLSAMLEQHGSTRSTLRTCWDVTWRAKWNLGLNLLSDVVILDHEGDFYVYNTENVTQVCSIW